MEIKSIIDAWLKAGNQYDLKKYLDFYLPDAIIDDHSVGRKFTGHKGIKDYFGRYFVDYQTQTKMVDLIIQDDQHAHLGVEFTGFFPEGKIGGTFDFSFKENKIAFVKADLLHQ